MRISRLLAGFAMALYLSCASRLPAATIDLSAQQNVLLQSGDSLTFLFTDSSYSEYSSAMGMSPYPMEVFFDLSSVPASSPGVFTAFLGSMDGSVSDPYATPLDWNNGLVRMSNYSGPASILSGSLTLSGGLSQQIFAGPAELTLYYQGPDLTLGLPGYALNEDLAISLENNSLSIGAPNYGVELTGGAVPQTPAPEPGSAALAVFTGLLFCLISATLKRFRSSVP